MIFNIILDFIRQNCKRLENGIKFGFESSLFNPVLVKIFVLNLLISFGIWLVYWFPSFDIKYYRLTEVKGEFENSEEGVSIFHVSSINMNQDFKSHRNLKCFCERWADDVSFGKNSLCQLKNYNIIQQIRNGCNGGGLWVFVHECLYYNNCKYFCFNNYCTGCLTVEKENKWSKNIFINIFTDNQAQTYT